MKSIYRWSWYTVYVQILLQHGPISVSPKLKLMPRNDSWQLNHNKIYVDSPVGAGFSFSDEAGYSNNEIQIGQNLMVALGQFLLMFPKYQKNELFVGGQSYGGKFVPAMGHAIHKDNKRQSNDPKKPKINLKGLIIGNGWTDPMNQYNYADYLYQLGLVDSIGQAALVKHQNKILDCLDYKCAFEFFDQLFIGFDYEHGTLFKNLTGLSTYHNALNLFCPAIWHIHSILHKLRNFIVRFMLATGKILEHLKLDFLTSIADWVAELLLIRKS